MPPKRIHNVMTKFDTKIKHKQVLIIKMILKQELQSNIHHFDDSLDIHRRDLDCNSESF